MKVEGVLLCWHCRFFCFFHIEHAWPHTCIDFQKMYVYLFLMCTVYCLHATKRPWFLVDMSHFLDRKPRIIFPIFLLLDSVMERLFIHLKSKLGSIDRRRSLLRCIINHCQRKPCVGNAMVTKLPLQISSHGVFQLFGPARLSWPPFFLQLLNVQHLPK